MGVPDFAAFGVTLVLGKRGSVTEDKRAYAEKSAEPVAARVASVERRACQTAPLWPMKVPILSIISGTKFLL